MSVQDERGYFKEDRHDTGYPKAPLGINTTQAALARAALPLPAWENLSADEYAAITRDHIEKMSRWDSPESKLSKVQSAQGKAEVTAPEKESIKILRECMELQIRKSKDYQNEKSRIRQADYYPRGVMSILDIIQAKTLRLFSVAEAMESDPTYTPNFESLEDSFKDLINYSSFGAAYIRGGIDGQDSNRDFLNRKVR